MLPSLLRAAVSAISILWGIPSSATDYRVVRIEGTFELWGHDIFYPNGIELIGNKWSTTLKVPVKNTRFENHSEGDSYYNGFVGEYEGVVPVEFAGFEFDATIQASFMFYSQYQLPGSDSNISGIQARFQIDKAEIPYHQWAINACLAGYIKPNWPCDQFVPGTPYGWGATLLKQIPVDDNYRFAGWVPHSTDELGLEGIVRNWGLLSLHYCFENVELESCRGDTDFRFTISRLTVAGVPEPAPWALMIAGFGLVGATARHRRQLAG